MNWLRKKIHVSIETYECCIYVKLFINKKQISKITCILQDDGRLLICDITPYEKGKYYQKGYGSLMMSRLLEYANENGIKYIHGNLSDVDKDHQERLHGFYRKHGFEVIEYKTPKDMYYGEIRKTIVPDSI